MHIGSIIGVEVKDNEHKRSRHTRCACPYAFHAPTVSHQLLVTIHLSHWPEFYYWVFLFVVTILRFYWLERPHPRYPCRQYAVLPPPNTPTLEGKKNYKRGSCPWPFDSVYRIKFLRVHATMSVCHLFGGGLTLPGWSMTSRVLQRSVLHPKGRNGAFLSFIWLVRFCADRELYFSLSLSHTKRKWYLSDYGCTLYLFSWANCLRLWIVKQSPTPWRIPVAVPNLLTFYTYMQGMNWNNDATCIRLFIVIA